MVATALDDIAEADQVGPGSRRKGFPAGRAHRAGQRG